MCIQKKIHLSQSLTFAGCPGPYQFANPGRPAKTGIIRRFFLTQSHFFTVPPRLKPVNSPAESQSTRTGNGLSRRSAGRAPVVVGSAPVKACSVPA
ncbi:hypothetical protein DPMN_128985 [Dreissena polymorpha]|uniref:Uncharacterized protein n=1 Tax=Dreissena polymorpha TaxID=45954 RepID=A0A9D4H0F1_DREPO|nr:hypothetical protein DPMN_128985 [Dreissena polymorpha]